MIVVDFLFCIYIKINQNQFSKISRNLIIQINFNYIRYEFFLKSWSCPLYLTTSTWFVKEFYYKSYRSFCVLFAGNNEENASKNTESVGR